MTDYTYGIPDKFAYFKALIAVLKKEGNEDTAEILKHGSCNIDVTTQFSYRRWNAFWSAIVISLPLDVYDSDKLDFLNAKKDIIRIFADRIMPGNAGYDVMDVRFVPSLDPDKQTPSVDVSLKESIEKVNQELQRLMIPEDIVAEAKTMSESYSYTYCIENSIRTLIENIAKKNFGDTFIESLNLNHEMEKKIKQRKRDEELWKWVSSRGKSDLYYLDFEDLGGVIRLNWSLFQHLFPSQEWICVRVTDLSKIRNPIAHHCLINDDDKDFIQIAYRQILSQVQTALQ